MVRSFFCAVLVAILSVIAVLLVPPPPVPWPPFPDRLAAIPEQEAKIDNVSPYNGADKWARNGSQAGLHLMNPTRVEYFDSRIRSVLKPPFRVLDIGCGGGLVSNALAPLGGYKTIDGIDLSVESLQYARDTAAKPGNGVAEVRFHEASVYELPFGEGDFDAVIMSDVVEHFLDIPRALAEAARVLKPGGILLFDTIERTFISWFVAILGAEHIVRIVNRGTHDWRLFVRPAELEKALKAAGFSGFTYEGFQPSLRALLELTAFSAGLIQAESMSGSFGIEPASSLMVSYIGHAVRT